MPGLTHRVGIFGVMIVLLAATVSFSAEIAVNDVVLLNNGAVVKGTIIKREEGKKIIVRMLDGKEISIPFKKISQITTSDANYEEAHQQIIDSVQQHRGTALSVIETNLHVRFNMRTGKNVTAFGVSGVVELLTNKNFSIGPGVAWDQHKYGSLLPIFSEACYYFPLEGIKPFLYGRAGFSIGWIKDLVGTDFGGARWGVGAGAQKKISNKYTLTAQVGYEKQNLMTVNPKLAGYPDWISASVGLKM